MIQIEDRVRKLIQVMKGLIYTDKRPAGAYEMISGSGVCYDSPKTLMSRQDWTCYDGSRLTASGERRHFFFREQVTIPQEWAGKTVVYSMSTGVETCFAGNVPVSTEPGWDPCNPQIAVFVNGELRQGLDENHREVLLAENCVGGETFDILLRCFNEDRPYYLMPRAVLRVLDRATEKYYYDLSVPFETAVLQEKESDAYLKIIPALNESLNLVDLRIPHNDSYRASLAEASDWLQKNFYEKYCGQEGPVMYCVGHTHIDLAWLWTLEVTEDKVVRSFSTVLELMKQYPEYIFMSSQPQLYQYVKKNAPEIYEQIKERIAEGRWEADGGMWVEADCNLTGAEALVRQFLHGKRFFLQEFGVENHMLWLPDVFGYSAALPQILKKCGLTYFMTTKINWNEFNRMPYDTFEWEGIDGTRVLTHFIPTRDSYAPVRPGRTNFFTTYNGHIDPSHVVGGWKRYSQKYLNNEVLNSFGHGDGGGGATAEMLENARRLEKGIPGAPKTKMSTGVQFFRDLEKSVEGKKYLPRWVGELYLEYHRGTYTSMARNKKYNRKSEFACMDLEVLSVLNQVLNQVEYPADLLHKEWEMVLKNQFHDILPGSGIGAIYEDSKREYEALLAENAAVSGETLNALASSVKGTVGDAVVFWPHSMAGDGDFTSVVRIPEEDPEVTGYSYQEGEETVFLPAQRTEDGILVTEVPSLPSEGYRVLHSVKNQTISAPEMKVTVNQMENQFLRITFNEKGQFAEILDKRRNRQLLMPGQAGNVIMTYEDRPHNYDAWDLNHYYTEKTWEADDLASIEVVENGPVRSVVRVKRNYLNSTICQDIILYADSARIDIKNVIDWKESQLFVKALFPVDVHASEATYEIQFGNVKRPTHSNTTWDMAKFEVCMHKWADLSEDDYGVALLTDSKYGCSIQDGVIGLSMLKSATYPNPDADKELHEFTFSIYPHEGDFREGNVIAQAYDLNDPAKAVVKTADGGSLPEKFSLAAVDQAGVIIEAVKKAEDSSAIILRLYEAFNRRCETEISFGIPVKGLWECSMMEEEETAIPVLCAADDDCSAKATLSFRPFEIKTLKVQF